MTAIAATETAIATTAATMATEAAEPEVRPCVGRAPAPRPPRRMSRLAAGPNVMMGYRAWRTGRARTAVPHPLWSAPHERDGRPAASWHPGQGPVGGEFSLEPLHADGRAREQEHPIGVEQDQPLTPKSSE